VQSWVKETGQRVVMVFEGRDAAGKGGTIKRFMEHLNPRGATVVALTKPTDEERGQWYFQRYIKHLPTAGEITMFDRSWYNRAGVEGFCSAEDYQRFLRQAPIFERMLVEDGILLRKYWFCVSDAEQEARFKSRLTDPMRRWKLSPMDFESITRWEDYSRAKDAMFVHTDVEPAPWFVVESDDKRRARVNMISHLLSTIPYTLVPPPQLPAARHPAQLGVVGDLQLAALGQLVARLARCRPARRAAPAHRALRDQPLRGRARRRETALHEQLVGAHCRSLSSGKCRACRALASARRCRPPAPRSAR